MSAHTFSTTRPVPFKRGSVWWVRYVLNGHQVRESLATNDKDVARRACEEVYRRLVGTREDEVLGVVMDHLERLRARLLTTQAARSGIRLANAFDLYVASPNRPKAASRTKARTMSLYRGQWDSLLRHLGHRVEYLGGISREDVYGYIEASRETKAPSTIEKHIKFFGLLHKTLLPDAKNPFSGLVVPGHHVVQQYRPLTLAEARRVYGQLSGCWREIWQVGVVTGADVGDLCTLSRDNIDAKRGLLSFVRRKTSTKRPRPVVIPLPPKTLDLLSRSGSGPVWSDACSMWNKDDSAVSKRFSTAISAAGLSAGQGWRIGFKSLRHTLQTVLDESGVSRLVTRQILGHAGEKTMSDTYSHAEFVQESRAALVQVEERFFSPTTFPASLPRG